MEIGRGKSGRRAYALDEIGIVPSRRTRRPEDVSITWQIDAYRFELPLVTAPMDSVVSPATAIAIGKLGGLAVLDIEGVWTRYDDPEPLLQEMATLDDATATARLQQIYAEPIKDELIGQRISEIKAAGVTIAARLSPQRTLRYHKAVIDAGTDFVVIRGTTVSAEHVSSQAEPLNLKHFIYELDVPVIVGGCATYTAALHLMRTGAAGVLVGFGGGSGQTTAAVLGVKVPMATAVADVAAALDGVADLGGDQRFRKAVRALRRKSWGRSTINEDEAFNEMAESLKSGAAHSDWRAAGLAAVTRFGKQTELAVQKRLHRKFREKFPHKII